MDSTLNMLSPQFLISLIVSFVMAVVFMAHPINQGGLSI